MYQEFARAATSREGILTCTGTPEAVATTITDLVAGGSARIPVD
jgi:hypothetical protein